MGRSLIGVATLSVSIWAMGLAGAGVASSAGGPGSAGGLSVRVDFDRDGYGDLAVAAPNDSQGRGAVNVIRGSARGLTSAGNQYWTQDSPGIKGTAEVNDWFGGALASGDFDGDGFVDLAVGVAEGLDRGAVSVIYGSARGLTSTGNQYWTQDSPGIKGTAEVNDGFGGALTAGDFDGDGFMDLAVGAFGEDAFRGAVQVIRGSVRGLTANGNQYWTQDSPGIKGTAQDSDQFGSVLAAANFGRSGQADLAVGAPGERTYQGAVNVIYGSARGLAPAGNQYWTKDSPGISGRPMRFDHFGAELAAASFGRSGHSDLAVGARGDHASQGAVNVIYGSARGLTGVGAQYWTQDSPGIKGSGKGGDVFGWGLSAADFGGTAQADLAVGAPRDNANTGAVNVIYGSPRGLTSMGNQYWTQDSPGITGTAEQIDLFGSSMSAVDLGRSAQADLAIGAPWEDGSRGAVNVIYGSPGGLSASGNQYWTQDSPGIGGQAARLDLFGGPMAAPGSG